MRKLIFLLLIIIATAAYMLGRVYVAPQLEQYNEDVQAYHKRNLLPE